MCLGLTVTIYMLSYMQAKAEFEDHHTQDLTFSSSDHFTDIYTHGVSLPADDIKLTSSKAEDFRIHSIPTQYVEFRIKPEPTVATPPPPKYLLKYPETTTQTSLPTTELPEPTSVEVIPVQKKHEKGVLDVLFPAYRVKTFKNVFDTFRRLLSHTFRK